MLLSLFLIILVPDCDRLGDPEFSSREECESQLKAMGCLAWPALLKAERSESQEVRMRASRLLTGYRSWRIESRIQSILFGEMPPIQEIFDDRVLRSRLKRKVESLGCTNRSMTHYLDGENDFDGWWNNLVSPVVKLELNILACRDYLKAKP
jgi:hypothetical protein